MKKSALALSALAIVLFSALFSSGSVAIIHAPRDRITDSNSTNWSGYAIATNLKHVKNGAVSDVKGTWTVPAIVSGTPANQYSSFWIGIDGYSSSTVEQIGTDSDTNSAGQPIYYAWYEMYPKYPVNLDTTTYPVSSADTINAEITYTGSGKFTLQITDANRWTFTTNQTSNSAKRSSAEWIAEAPWSGGVLPLANFGTVTFSSCQATLNDHTGSISDSAWQYDKITMVTSSGTTTKAQPSTLSPDGSSFSITWQHQ